MARRKKSRGITLHKKPLFREQDGCCHYCSCAMTLKKTKAMTPPGNYATWDHKLSVGAGGTDDPENLVLACWDCNMRKRTMPYDLFVSARVWEMPKNSADLLAVQCSAARRGQLDIIYHMARYCPSCDVEMTLPHRIKSTQQPATS